MVVCVVVSVGDLYKGAVKLKLAKPCECFVIGFLLTTLLRVKDYVIP